MNYHSHTHTHTHTLCSRCSISAQLSEDTPIEWNEVVTAVVSVSDGRLWLGTDSGLYVIQRAGDALTLHNTTSVEGRVTSLAWRSSLSTAQRRNNHRSSFIFDPTLTHLPPQYLAHSSSGGTYSVGSSLHREPLGRDSFGLLVVGTRERVYFFNGERWWFEWVSGWYGGQGGAVDGVPSSMTFTLDGDLFIGNNVSLTRVNFNYTFDRLGPLQGLPYNQIQSLHHSSYTPLYPPALMHSPSDCTGAGASGALWVGSSRGFAIYDLSSSQFKHYMYGRRWHPGERVVGLPAVGEWYGRADRRRDSRGVPQTLDSGREGRPLPGDAGETHTETRWVVCVCVCVCV